MSAEYSHLEELDLAIPNMDSEPAEQAVKASLEMLPGILSVMLVGRGTFARYNPKVVNESQICAAVRQAGFRVSIFRSSETGHMGLSSQ